MFDIVSQSKRLMPGCQPEISYLSPLYPGMVVLLGGSGRDSERGRVGVHDRRRRLGAHAHREKDHPRHCAGDHVMHSDRFFHVSVPLVSLAQMNPFRIAPTVFGAKLTWK